MLNEPLSHSLLDYFFGCSHANDVEHEINKWFSNWFSAFLFVCVSVAFIGDKLFDWFSSLPALLGRSHLRQSLTSFKPPSSGKKKENEQEIVSQRARGKSELKRKRKFRRNHPHGRAKTAGWRSCLLLRRNRLIIVAWKLFFLSCICAYRIREHRRRTTPKNVCAVRE